jgi:hypothetical protein
VPLPAGSLLALQSIEKKGDMDPLLVLELLLRSAFVLNDAAVKAWDIKYTYTVERPETYIQRIIQPNWQPFHSSPSFPAYLSGHAIFGSAVAGVLTHTFGDHFKLTDYSHENRKNLWVNQEHLKRLRIWLQKMLCPECIWVCITG